MINKVHYGSWMPVNMVQNTKVGLFTKYMYPNVCRSSIRNRVARYIYCVMVAYIPVIKMAETPTSWDILKHRD